MAEPFDARVDGDRMYGRGTCDMKGGSPASSSRRRQRQLMILLAVALPEAGAAPPGRTGAPYWMESALWQAACVPAVVCGPAGGELHAVGEWVDLVQLRRFPAAVADAVGRFLADPAA